MFLAAGLPAAPPVDMSPADGWLTVALVAAASAVALSVVLAVRNWRRTGSPLHLVCLAAGLLCALDEPMEDLVGKCWFPHKQIAFTVYGRGIPWWVVCCYVLFFGNLPYLFARAFEKGMTRRFFWQAMAAGFAFNAVIEIPFLNTNVYTYYGHQPFNVAGFPLWWMFVNTGGALSAGVLIWRFFLPALRSKPGLMAAVPFLTGPTYLAWSLVVGLPLHTALNSEAALWVTTLTGAVTIGLALGAYHLYTQIACTDGAWRADRPQPQPGPIAVGAPARV
ncbi:MAG TPA: hypothetical protein VGO87_07090 [Acidimicrobiia bacterium]